MNWFYSNFPPGNWATANTVMTTSNVDVYERHGESESAPRGRDGHYSRADIFHEVVPI